MSQFPFSVFPLVVQPNEPSRLTYTIVRLVIREKKKGSVCSRRGEEAVVYIISIT